MDYPLNEEVVERNEYTIYLVLFSCKCQKLLSFKMIRMGEIITGNKRSEIEFVDFILCLTLFSMLKSNLDTSLQKE